MDQPSKKDRKPQPLSIRIGEAFAQARAILEEARVPARLSDFCSIDGLFPHEDMPSLHYEDSAIEWGDSICAYFRAHESECYQAAEDYGLDHCPDEAVRRYLDREEEEDEGDDLHYYHDAASDQDGDQDGGGGGNDGGAAPSCLSRRGASLGF